MIGDGGGLGEGWWVGWLGERKFRPSRLRDGKRDGRIPEGVINRKLKGRGEDIRDRASDGLLLSFPRGHIEDWDG